MALKGKIGSFCRVLMLAASVTAITVGAASPQDLNTLNQQILEDPGNVDLNLRYARAAEAEGKLRLALVAYERVLINDPTNEDARRGYERIRRAIEPAFTVTRVEVGARWDSNPANLATDEEEGVTLFARGTSVIEAGVGSGRWRTVVQAELENTPDISELNYAYLGAQSGPIYSVGPHTAAVPAVGIAGSTLDGHLYFTEANLGVTVEGRTDSFSYWWRARGGWRDYSEESTSDNGPYVELMGGVTAPQFITERGTFVAVPWVRWSDIEGGATNFLDEYVPGQYTEYGLDAEYRYRVTDHVQLAAGVRARQRDYDNTTVNLGADTRSDTYVAPNATVTFAGMLPCSCDVRVRYTHRDNDSNDDAFEYEADQVSASLIARF